jgi:hypothetical protein
MPIGIEMEGSDVVEGGKAQHQATTAKKRSAMLLFK